MDPVFPSNMLLYNTHEIAIIYILMFFNGFVYSAMLELLDLGYSPSIVRKVCREIAKYKSRHEKTGTTMNSTSSK